MQVTDVMFKTKIPNGMIRTRLAQQMNKFLNT